MTLITLNEPIYYPQKTGHLDGSIANASTLDAATEYYAVIFAAKEAMTISHVGLKLNTATGSPTVDIRIETVDTSTGLPSGTLWATNTNIVTGTLTTTWAVHALTASASISKGQVVCLKILYNSGTSAVLSGLNIGSTMAGLAFAGLPYIITNTSGSPTFTYAGNLLNCALGSSSTTFYNVPGLLPVVTRLTVNFDNTVAGDARGVRFQVPYNCRCTGLSYGFPSSHIGAHNIKLLDDSGSELSSSSTAYPKANGSSQNRNAYFDNSVLLTKNTWYRAVLEPTTTDDIGVYAFTAASTDVISSLPGGSYWHYTTYTTGGGWVDSGTSDYPLMSLIIDQIDDGTGSGASHFSAFVG